MCAQFVQWWSLSLQLFQVPCFLFRLQFLLPNIAKFTCQTTKYLFVHKCNIVFTSKLLSNRELKNGNLWWALREFRAHISPVLGRLLSVLLSELMSCFRQLSDELEPCCWIYGLPFCMGRKAEPSLDPDLFNKLFDSSVVVAYGDAIELKTSNRHHITTQLWQISTEIYSIQCLLCKMVCRVTFEHLWMVIFAIAYPFCLSIIVFFSHILLYATNVSFYTFITGFKIDMYVLHNHILFQMACRIYCIIIFQLGKW